MDITGIFNALLDHALTSALFETVNSHEPTSPPVNSGLAAGLVFDKTRPAPAESGLDATTVLMVFRLHIFMPLTELDSDDIDPAILAAADQMMAAYTGDFTLGGLIKDIDPLGRNGFPLVADGAYVKIAGVQHRAVTIQIPTIVNDAWSQSP